MNAVSGVLNWRPLVTQSDTKNLFTIKVANNGSPSMSATQSFVVTVSPLARPQFSTPSLSGGQLQLEIYGVAGPDYQIQSSTNLVDWTAVFTTNSPTLPFVCSKSVTNEFPINFSESKSGLRSDDEPSFRNSFLNWSGRADF